MCFMSYESYNQPSVLYGMVNTCMYVPCYIFVLNNVAKSVLWY